MKIFYLFLLLLLQEANAQVTLQGSILSKNKMPVAGATILSAGGGSSMSAGDGSFILKATVSNPVLTVSHAGYRTIQLKITDPKIYLMVTLEEAAITLEEVTVSTGYQDIAKERSTGSFTHVDNKLLNEQVGTKVLERLEAVAGSLLIDRKASDGGIMIRGLSTIRGPRSPLIILDNFPYAGDISNINPNDVESVTILKDAAAASIWGAKAGNGVIVITTKKGKFSQQLNIEFSSNVTIGEEPDLFYQPQMSTGDYIDVEQMLFSKGYKFSDTALSTRPAFSPVYEILFKKRSGRISEAEATAQINALRGEDVRKEYKKYFYHPSVNQQYALSLSGGSPSLSWILAAGYDKNMSNLNAGYERINARFSNTLKLSRKLQFTSGIYVTQSRSESGNPSYGSIVSKPGILYPYTRFSADNGNPLPIVKDYRQGYIDTTGAGKLLDWRYFPLEDYKHVTAATRQYDLLGTAGLTYRLFDFLNLELKYQFERQQADNSYLQDADSYAARDLVNRYSQLNRSTGLVTYKIPKGGVLDLNESSITGSNLRAQINFDKVFGEHALTWIAGAELSDTKTAGNGYRTYGYNDDILTSANVDLANTYPTWISGSSAFIPSNNSFSQKVTRFVSLFTNAAYTWKSRYTLNVSGRRDASNLFGVNTNDKWTPLWSAGAGWKISDEKFYRLSFFPFLKLRLTYGFSGNIDPAMSAVTTIAYLSSSPYTLSPYAEVRNFKNPELRWEKVGMLNIGADFKSRNDRISGSIEFYHKNATDLFGNSPLDYTAGLGVNTVIRNVASMKGDGADLELNILNVNRRIRWTTSLNLSYYKDKVTAYYLSSKTGSTFINYGEGLSGVEGRPVYSVFSYRWAGLDPLTGDPQGFVNGAVSKDYNTLTGSNTTVTDMVYNGSLFPTVFGSAGNTISWKQFSFTARIVYKFGYYFRKTSIDYSNLYGAGAWHGDYSRRWQKPGDEQFTSVPSLVYPAVGARDVFYLGSETLVQKGDNIRLQYITLSYSPEKLPRKTPLQHLRFFVTVTNLGLLWRANKDGIDPDYKSSAIPPSKSLAFGLNVSFK